MDVTKHHDAGKANQAQNHQLAWQTSPSPVGYQEALAFMEQRAEAVKLGSAPELIWFLEHPPLITAGTSARPADLLEPERFDVFDAGRGGQYTYHGPGQRIVYCILDLRKRGRDLRAFVCKLEAWMIAVLAQLGVHGERRQGRIGIWVETPKGEAKIGAIGVRIRHWVSFHGLSLNVDPDLSHFDAIVPCGIREYGVTSLAELGISVSSEEVDAIFKQCFADVFDD